VHEYLDLLSMDQMREEVVGMPQPDSRDWPKYDE
jgi:hypothetical protein